MSKVKVFAAERASYTKAGERKKVWHSWEQRIEQSSWSTGDEWDEVSESGPS